MNLKEKMKSSLIFFIFDPCLVLDLVFVRRATRTHMESNKV